MTNRLVPESGTVLFGKYPSISKLFPLPSMSRK
uniref:Uncharacterized protein n=1 Tax=Anguilla anguilla TaxID=7936 RepID=A0A0E9WNW1_ANGAN